MPDEKITFTHPSYGQISASRVSCNPAQPLYGSKLKHRNYVVLSISTSELDRSLSRDWFHNRKQIIQVAMSETQFAQFITSLNVGGGAPCTIQRLQGERIEDPPFFDEKESIHTEFAKTAQLVGADLDSARKKLAELTAPGAKITKAALSELQSELDRAARNIKANMPYVEEQFQEAVESIVGAARAEIETHFVQTVQRLGLDAAQAQMPIMLDAKKEDTE